MRSVCIFFAITLLLQSLISYAEPPSTDKALSLGDCIGIALENQPSVRDAKAQVEIQKGALQQARSALLPDASISGSQTLANSSDTTGSSLRIGADQLIYDFGRTSAQVSQAIESYDASVLSLEAAQSDTVLNVKTAYYTLLQKGRLVEVYEKYYNSQLEHVDEAQARYDAGVAPRSDMLKASAAAASARVDLVNARNSYEQARVDLNIAMGIDVRKSTQITETTEPASEIPTEDQAIGLALENRPEMKKSQAQVRAAEYSLKSANTGNLPSISASGSKSMYSDDDSTWQVGLSMSWRPFDLGDTRGAIKQAEGRLASARDSHFVTSQTVSRDAIIALFNLQASGELLSASMEEVSSAKEDLDAAAGRYQAGIGILLEVLDAQAALLKAEVDEASARYGLSISRAEMDHAIGATSLKGNDN